MVQSLLQLPVLIRADIIGVSCTRGHIVVKFGYLPLGRLHNIAFVALKSGMAPGEWIDLTKEAVVDARRPLVRHQGLLLIRLVLVARLYSLNPCEAE